MLQDQSVGLDSKAPEELLDSDGRLSSTSDKPKDLTTQPLEEPRYIFTNAILTAEKIQFVWEKMLQFPFVFDDFSFKNQQIYLDALKRRDTVIFEVWREGQTERLDDMAGWVTVSNVTPFLDGFLHFLFFDRKLKDKDDVLFEILQHTVATFQLRRISCAIPGDRATGIHMLSRLGFKREGRIRKKFLRKGEYLDMLLFGLLAEELI